jgi:hypothetical protein|tara:strand:- start:343 stop:591 length:249 start_codon:yes stop_codon:yes gene_type:complete
MKLAMNFSLVSVPIISIIINRYKKEKFMYDMILFVLGFCVIIAGVGAVEGTAPLGTGIFLATVGVMLMVCGLFGMADKGELG